MTKILICTHNQGKFKEISTLLSELPVELVSLEQAGVDFDVEETGETYEENAVLKAKTYGEKTGLLSIADDTGLEVTALNGAPGVHSKRFFKTSGEERNKELNELIGANQNRQAKFVASVAIFDPKTNVTKTFSGEVEGKIIETSKGEAHKALGYDSVFYVEPIHKTLAEATLEEKNAIAHRGIAVRNSLDYLKTLL